jgi:hypothetical protein
MPPAVIFYDPYNEVPTYHRPDDDWFTGGENWDEELVVPGQMFYIGQGQMMFLRIDEVEPGMMWPKRRRRNKKKKASSTPPPPPAPVIEPAPIDWGDWEELCQAAPPLPPPPVPSPPALPDPLPTPWEPEDWDAEIAASQWEPEDWDAELASQWEPEDWDAELASQWEPEDWDAELASQWEPEDWDAELASQ